MAQEINYDDIKTRIAEVFADKQLSVGKFSFMYGLEEDAVNEEVYGKAPLRLETVMSVLHMCPELDSGWLLFGTCENVSNQAFAEAVGKFREIVNKQCENLIDWQSDNIRLISMVNKLQSQIDISGEGGR